MKILYGFLVVFALLVIAGFIAYSYYGGFTEVVITENEEGGETIVYKELRGEYSQSKAAMDEITVNGKEFFAKVIKVKKE